MLNRPTDNWQAIKEIARILALFAPQDDDRLVAENIDDGPTLFRPDSIELGVLSEPFQEMAVMLSNFGIRSSNLLSCTCSDSSALFRGMVDGHDSWIAPLSSEKLSLLVQAIDKMPGRYAVQLTAKYQDMKGNGESILRIAFEVPPSSGFAVYAHPGCLSLGSGNDIAIIKCANYSDLRGDVRIAHDGFPTTALDTFTSLAPRETIRLRYSFRGWTPQKFQKSAQIRIINTSDGVERVIPVIPASHSNEPDKSLARGTLDRATASLRLVRRQPATESVSNES